MAKKTSQKTIDTWADVVRRGGMTLDQFSDADRRRVERVLAAPKPTKKQGIMSDLMVASDRVNHVGGTPATEPQCKYLANLLDERGLDAEAVGCGCLNTQAMLTKRRASELIDSIINGTF